MRINQGGAPAASLPDLASTHLRRSGLGCDVVAGRVASSGRQGLGVARVYRSLPTNAWIIDAIMYRNVLQHLIEKICYNNV
jgi:hypothetical protein